MHSSLFNFELDGMAAEHSPSARPQRKFRRMRRIPSLTRLSPQSFRMRFAQQALPADPFVSSQLTGALFTIPEPDRENGAILIDCGGQHCDVSLIYDNALLCSESIGIGGEHFTRDIAYGLRLPFSTAESIKRRYVFGLDYGGSVERVMIPGEGLATLSCGAIQSVIEARIRSACG